MDYIEKRLKCWANWFSKHHDKEGLGFNSYTRAYVLQELGTMPQQEQKPRAPYNEDAELLVSDPVVPIVELSFDPNLLNRQYDCSRCHP